MDINKESTHCGACGKTCATGSFCALGSCCTPTESACDSKDNDCDGKVDEHCSWAIQFSGSAERNVQFSHLQASEDGDILFRTSRDFVFSSGKDQRELHTKAWGIKNFIPPQTTTTPLNQGAYISNIFRTKANGEIRWHKELLSDWYLYVGALTPFGQGETFLHLRFARERGMEYEGESYTMNDTLALILDAQGQVKEKIPFRARKMGKVVNGFLQIPSHVLYHKTRQHFVLALWLDGELSLANSPMISSPTMQLWLIAFTRQGQVLWSRPLGHQFEPYGIHLNLQMQWNASQDAFYLSAYSYSQYNGQSKSIRPFLFLSKFDPNGKELWLKEFALKLKGGSEDYDLGLQMTQGEAEIFLSFNNRESFSSQGKTWEGGHIVLKNAKKDGTLQQVLQFEGIHELFIQAHPSHLLRWSAFLTSPSNLLIDKKPIDTDPNQSFLLLEGTATFGTKQETLIPRPLFADPATICERIPLRASRSQFLDAYNSLLSCNFQGEMLFQGEKLPSTSKDLFIVKNYRADRSIPNRPSNP